MLAFHETTVTKPQIIKQLKAHAKADEFVKGKYWQDGKGCAVGCTIHGSNHAEYETRFGIPQMLAKLEDCIFEGLPNDKAKKWPLRFMQAIKPGADLRTVGWEFQHRLQINNLKLAQAQKFPKDVIKSIQMVIDVLEPMTKVNKVNQSAARSARSAMSAAWSAAAAAAAESVAESVAMSAARSAMSAMSAAAASAAWSAAWSVVAAAQSAESAYEEMADLMIEILEAH